LQESRTLQWEKRFGRVLPPPKNGRNKGATSELREESSEIKKRRIKNRNLSWARSEDSALGGGKAASYRGIGGRPNLKAVL